MTVTHLSSIARKRAPRLAGDARRAQIVTAACSFFADNGFSGPTRDLAASIGVTQALLYRYFESKTDLIESVFAETFRTHWSEGALETFAASAGQPMVDRVAEVYAGMIGRMTATSTRLLFRAGLDSYGEPVARNLARSWPVWVALLDQWRTEEGVPSLAERPLLEGERTLMHAFHNAMMTIRVRAFVFGFTPTLDDAEEVRQVAETHDAGVRSVLRSLHSGAVTTPRALPASEGALVAA